MSRVYPLRRTQASYRQNVLHKTCGKPAVLRVVGPIMALLNVTAADDPTDKTSLPTIATCTQQGRSVFEYVHQSINDYLAGRATLSVWPAGP
jgi:hypothetical protein